MLLSARRHVCLTVAKVWQALHGHRQSMRGSKGRIGCSGHHLGEVRAERPLIKAFLNIADSNLVMIALTNGYNGILHVIPTIRGGPSHAKVQVAFEGQQATDI